MKDKFLLLGGTVLALPKGSLVCSDRVFWKEQTEEGSGESLQGRGVLFSFFGLERGKFWVRGKGCASQGGAEGGRKPALHPFRPQIKGRKLGRQRVNRRPAEEELGSRVWAGELRGAGRRRP